MNAIEITQHRLHNQKLLETDFTKPSQVVTWLGAVQSQDYAGAKWALAQRIKNETKDSDLDKAFADGSILRTHVLRPTWHFVAPADIRWMLQLTAPRVHAFNAYMYRKSELDDAVLKKGKALLVKTLRDGKQMTRDELRDVFEKNKISMKKEFRMTYMMMWAELEGVICSGGRKGKQFTYALLEERAPQVKAVTRDEALAELVRRYFISRGPATIQDFAWWSGLTMADAKNGIEMVKSELLREEINGQTYWLQESALPKIKPPLVHVLPNYDEYFIGFKDRSAIGNRIGNFKLGDSETALYVHIIFIDGQVVGGWKRTFSKNEAIVELSMLTNITKAEKQALHIAFQKYGEFLGMPVRLLQ